ncbi:type II toxin-antitoxin system ParD family antitoxin [Paracidobacterium acidisoli]|uniref:Type II toxin-antitoxin system ParD family antitoxin n=1 Tax=Paracidobacterium acidisoli TaxID=2303751 RepID=A0A372ISA6_9BACT|nr:type II toxin-antitoxin system ParD family antitoxin [Paracidobacterium acidisoli]MBT9330739.1 type II toxin-antitoxin system ParD family antitoxin [Paracidobacterium acidisoli]
MPTRNVHLTPELDSFVSEKIQSGRYDNASEVIRAGLRALEQAELEDKAKVEALRTAIQAGIDSRIAKGDVIGRTRAYLRELAAKTA